MNTAVDIRKEPVGAVERYDLQPDPFIQMIERVVLDPNASVEKLERMLALRNEAEDRARKHAREDAVLAATQAYMAAMARCQAELPVVVKKSRNTHTNSNYADLAAIESQAMPVIHRHGFAVSFQPDGYNEKGELRILWQVSHSGGHLRSGVGEIPVDGAGSQGKVNKTGTQAFGSTATYGRRYLLCMLFNISTGDDRDGNASNDAGDVITEDQLLKLHEMIEAVGANSRRFCEIHKIATLADLRASEFDAAMNRLRDYGRRQGK